MKSYYDVLQFLKGFGTFIYTGDARSDLEMMMAEVKELYEKGLIMKEDYLKALMILRAEHRGK
ncbi:uncharacterized protein YqgQ [Sporosarcina luteola]|nr:uncharacterized protein YqgQ [Sporosarcina luteola]